MPINMLLEKGIDNIIAIDVKGVGFYRTFNLAGKNVINIKCSRPQTGTFDFDRDGIRKSIQDGYYVYRNNIVNPFFKQHINRHIV